MQNLMKRYITLLVLLVPAYFFGNIALAKTAELVQHNQNLKIDNRDGKLILDVTQGKTSKLLLEKILFNYQEAKRWEITASNADALELRGYFAPSVEFYRTVYDNEERIVNLTISKVAGGFRLHAAPKWGRQATLELKDLNDHIFGLTEGLQPDNRLSPDLRNSVIQVDVNAEEASMHENFASAHSAFYMSSLGYGAFSPEALIALLSMAYIASNMTQVSLTGMCFLVITARKSIRLILI